MSAPLTSATEVLSAVKRTIADGVASARHPWHWPALATALDNRIVVLRDADLDAGTVRWYTDRRSEKVAQLNLDARVVLLFFHGDQGRQLRLYGTNRELSDRSTRENLWDEVSPRARANYLTRHPPGTQLPAAGSDLPEDWPKTTEEQDRTAFEHFAVMQVEVSRADFLQLLPDGSALRCGWEQRDPESTFYWKAP